MNLVQVVMLLGPAFLAYLYFVLTAKSGGKINRWANLFGGLIVVPLMVGFTPFILVGVFLNALKKRAWVEGIVTLIYLLLIVAYGALIVFLGDRPPPSPADLPVER